MSSLPDSFVFTDVQKANAEVDRLYRAVSLSGDVVMSLLDMVSDANFPEAKRVADDLCAKLDAISDERDAQ
jgi:hypothetical protein